MGVPPTDLDAWEALQPLANELDTVRRAKELKQAMYGIISENWDISHSRVSLVDFGVIWIDPNFRRICGKFAKMGPGRETFEVGVYRALKTSRIEGYWDVLLENLADWVERFAKESRANVTLDDYERLLGCMPPGQNLKTYRQNIKDLFWPTPGQRQQGFLDKLSAAAYEDAFNTVLTDPPNEGWNLKFIMNEIREKAIACKSIMLHVDFWFDPDLEEPANRTNVKPPMFYHLKLPLSKYDPSHHMYEADESWKPQALELQRVVIKYTVDNWIKSNNVIGNLGMLRDMSAQKYGEYLRTEFWINLLHEVRGHTQVPFRHPSLVGFKNIEDLPPLEGGQPRVRADVDLEEFRGRVEDVIREEYSDQQTPDSREDDENPEGVDDSNFGQQYAGRENAFFATVNSPPPEALAVESDDERDIIHVQTPSPAQVNPSKRRKVQYNNEDLGYTPVYDDQHVVLQEAQRKLVKLKYPSNGTPSSDTRRVAERPRNLARKQVVAHASPLPQTLHESESATAMAPNAPSTTPVAGPVITAIGTQGKNTPWVSIEQTRNTEPIRGTENTIQQPGRGPPPFPWEEATRAWERNSRARLDLSPLPSDETERQVERARRALDEFEGASKSSNSRAHEPEEHLPSSDNQSFQVLRNNHNLSHLSSCNSTPNTYHAPTPSPAPPSLPRRSSSILVGTPTTTTNVSNNNNNNNINANKSTASATPSTNTPGGHVLHTNKTEQAILVLQDEFDEQLKIPEMLAAIKLLRNDFEAGIFLTLKPGPLRSAWLWDGIKDDVAPI